ncbi:hypothetical protein [uncultured Tateyamaria sp.]|uniref:hypothetical protein n=1 Tax=uncultured Tateyamaria sp. TaxID=455651 RepID=UPI00260B9ADF|nr:hypothetical protein [uncultured Tateyamaria sp.]
MLTRYVSAVAMAVLLSVSQGWAQTNVMENGGDTFVTGETLTQTLDATGDVFAMGRSTTVLGQTDGDFHASGFDVVIDAGVREDAYAAGATVTLKGTVAQDFSAAGVTVRTEATSRVTGNARLAGATVKIEGPIDGALSVTGRDVLLNAPVAGDVRIFARTLRFGPEGVVSGRLIYTTKEKTDVPERVAPATRVVFEAFSGGVLKREWTGIRDMPVFPTFASVFFGFLVTLLFFVLLGAIALGFAPRQVSWLRKSIGAAPGRTLLQGVVGLSIFLGAIPVMALTIVGLPFVPVALLAVILLWTLAYALGAYAIAMRLWTGLGGAIDPAIVTRLVVFAAAIIVVALLNFIPFVGWVANYTLVLLGVGAMTHAAFLALVPDIDPALDADMRPVDDTDASS